jgi:hypothetical protein
VVGARTIEVDEPLPADSRDVEVVLHVNLEGRECLLPACR